MTDSLQLICNSQMLVQKVMILNRHATSIAICVMLMYFPIIQNCPLPLLLSLWGST